MNVRSIRMTALTALIAGLAWSGTAQAYWGLDNGGNGTTTSTSAKVNDSGATAQNPYTVQMSGFYVANTLVGGNGANKNQLAGNWTANALTNFAGGGQGMYSGTDNGSPYHALDNNQNTEGVLLSFSASTVLSSIGLGYVSNNGTGTEIGCKNASNVIVDTTTGSCGSGTGASGKSLAGTTSAGTTVDVSLFRWTGNSAPTLGGVGAGTMAGWELVGNYGDFVQDTSNPYNSVNKDGKTSSWWLITAYNSGFAQSAQTDNRGTLTNGDDFFKLYAAAGTACTKNVDANGVCGGTNIGKLPEPATLALTSVALVGVAGLRRRKAKVAA